MKLKLLAILNEDIADLENIDFGFNYLFIKHYYSLRLRLEHADKEVIEELYNDMVLFEKLHDRKQNKSAYYGNKLSLYRLDLGGFMV